MATLQGDPQKIQEEAKEAKEAKETVNSETLLTYLTFTGEIWGNRMKHDETETKSSELLTSTRASTVQPFASGFAKEMSQRYNKLSLAQPDENNEKQRAKTAS